ncbi:putative disease resistance RPP13-like protein 1 [Cornus florida]|uniref:putative disease resistance RPP13-like protein 1 n=1 Tax=Cornus florida TaxID=4283 RepID=UPI0028A25724|nr:putative disease resistance RPP13-like protein 1 [Cornus florida]
MGGIGKTTLAKLVYNDESIKDHFKFKDWVSVAHNFKLDIILNIMKKEFLATSYTPSMDNPQSKHHAFLKENCFLLVLDDVWTEDYKDWEQLERILTEGQRVLDDDKECWSLFCSAFSGEMSTDAEVTGRGIVGKCKGLPSVIIAMGRLLSHVDVNEWANILNNDIWKVEEQKHDQYPIIMPALCLSFDRLPSYLKHCFAYFSTFPKAYEFDKNELVKLWMAEGFIQMNEIDGTERIKRREEKGVRYFGGLLARSSFQEEKVGTSTTYKMHDLA